MPLLTIPPIILIRFNNGVRGLPDYGGSSYTGWGNGFVYEVNNAETPLYGLRARVPASGMIQIFKENSLPFNLGTGDFTLDWWEWLTRAEANSCVLTVSPYFNGSIWTGYAGIRFANRTALNGSPSLYLSSNGVSWDIAGGISLGATTLNTWNHYALSRKDGTFIAFKNGAVVATIPSSLPIYADTRILWGGAPGSTYLSLSSNYSNYVDEVCLTDYCRYDSEFTPIAEEYVIEPQNMAGYIPVAIDLAEMVYTPKNGLLLPDLQETVRSKEQHQALESEQILNADKDTTNYPGNSIDNVSCGDKSKMHVAINMESVSTGTKTASHHGYQLDDVKVGIRLSVQLNGILIEPVETTSNAEYRFKLLVTPTHQYKNQVVTVQASNSQGYPIIGRYQLEIGNTVAIPYGPADIDLRDISIELMPAQLVTGNNLCRLTYLYPDGKQEYLDFEIFKEEPKRTQVERLFRYYEGGYEGERFAPSSKYAPRIHPCFMVSPGAFESIIKTTDYTSIPLQKYTNIQGVFFDGAGLKILVSFDKGVTWRTFSESNWQSVDLGSISISGMTEEAVSSITMAQWSDVFTATSIDFAVLITSPSVSLIATPQMPAYVTLSEMTLNKTTSSFQSPNYIQAYYPSFKSKGKFYFETLFTGPSLLMFQGGAAASTVFGQPNPSTREGYFGRDYSSGGYLSINGVNTGNSLSNSNATPYGFSYDFDNKVVVMNLYSASIFRSGFFTSSPLLCPVITMRSGTPTGTATLDVFGQGITRDFTYDGRLPEGFVPWGLHYLKSINVQITPRLKTGYAFIM